MCLIFKDEIIPVSAEHRDAGVDRCLMGGTGCDFLDDSSLLSQVFTGRISRAGGVGGRGGGWGW